MVDVSVRPARPEDAAEIGRIQVTAWQSAYVSIISEPVLSGLDPEQAGVVWRQAITSPPTPQHHVLVAVEAEWLTGFAAVAPSDDLDPDDSEAQTTVTVGPLLVEPRWGRRGHGSRLLAAAVDFARRDGMTRAIIWLPEQDDVSRTFFGDAGWAADGLARALDTGAGELREVRLHTSLV